MKKAATVAVGIFILFSVLPFFAFAANTGIKSNVLNPLASDFALKNPLLICTGVPAANGTNNGIGATCSNLCDLIAQIANVIYFMIAIILWIITPVLVVVGGLMVMLAGASSEMVGRGKKTITGAVWSVVIVLCSWVIIATFVKVIGISGIGGFGTSSCSIIGGSASNNGQQ